MLAEDQFRLYAVCARFPQKLSGQVPWQERQAGVYACQWGTNVVRVIVAGQLPREEQNAALHLFSASPGVVDFGRNAYRQHSANTSSLIRVLFEKYKVEEIVMPYTIEDFQRDYAREHFAKLTIEEQLDALKAIPTEVLKSLIAERLAGESKKESRPTRYKAKGEQPSKPPKSRRRRS